MKIVVVEDEADLLSVNTELLQFLGHEVVGFVDSLEGLRWIKDNINSFDILITDKLMAGLRGDELIRKVHKLRPVPTVLTSGYLTHSDNLMGSELIHLEEKPFQVCDIDQLVAKLWPWLLEAVPGSHVEGGNVHLEAVHLVSGKAEEPHIEPSYKL